MSIPFRNSATKTLEFPRSSLLNISTDNLMGKEFNKEWKRTTPKKKKEGGERPWNYKRTKPVTPSDISFLLLLPKSFLSFLFFAVFARHSIHRLAAAQTHAPRRAISMGEFACVPSSCRCTMPRDPKGCCSRFSRVRRRKRARDRDESGGKRENKGKGDRNERRRRKKKRSSRPAKNRERRGGGRFTTLGALDPNSRGGTRTRGRKNRRERRKKCEKELR